MRILLINTHYFPVQFGGAEKSVQKIAERLGAEGHDVHVLTLGRRRENRTINGVGVSYFPVRNIYMPALSDASLFKKSFWHLLDAYNPLIKKDIERYIIELSPDIVHTHNILGFSVYIWKIIKSLDLPLVHTLRDYYLLCPRCTLFRNGTVCTSQCADCKFLSSPKKKLIHLPDALTGISKFVLGKHYEKNYFKETGIRQVIGNPVDPVQDSINHPAPDCKIKIGYLGRIEETKGIKRILENLPDRYRDLEMFIAGKGEESYVKKVRLEHESRDIHFMGFVRPDDLFSRVNYLIVPSVWNEPFGRVVIEAYSRGVPVIGSSRGGIAELIEHGRTGWLFNPDSGESLREILDQIRSLDMAGYRAMSEQCIIKSRQFSVGKIAADYLGLYNKVLRKEDHEYCH